MKVEVYPFDASLHADGTSSRDGNCAQGGKDTLYPEYEATLRKMIADEAAKAGAAKKAAAK